MNHSQNSLISLFLVILFGFWVLVKLENGYLNFCSSKIHLTAMLASITYLLRRR